MKASANFVPVRGYDGVYVLALKWKTFVSLRIFLCKLQNSTYTLIDTGAPEHAAIVSTALQTFLKKDDEDGTIDMIILTHAHIDHAGGLSNLLSSSLPCITPSTKVALHSLEVPFLLSQSYSSIPSTNLYFKLLTSLKLFQDFTPDEREAHQKLLNDRIVPLSHEDSVLNSFQVFHTPGHTPGHVCILHRDLKLLFAGDAIMNLKSLPCCSPKVSPSFKLSTPDIKVATASLNRMISHLSSSNSCTAVLPSHDDAGLDATPLSFARDISPIFRERGH